MRLFVGIELDAAAVAAAGALAAELRTRAERLAPHARLTWIPPQRMHLTVRFIGEANADEAQSIRGVLQAPLALPPFALTIRGTGTFPARGAPRVIWAGLTEGRDVLLAVERVVTARLQAAGIPPEARPYSPHLTIARVRDASGLRAGPLLDGLVEAVVGTTRVEAITLFESQLSPKGPTYREDLKTSLRE